MDFAHMLLFLRKPEILTVRIYGAERNRFYEHIV